MVDPLRPVWRPSLFMLAFGLVFWLLVFVIFYWATQEL